jgi:hypothetical protein
MAAASSRRMMTAFLGAAASGQVRLITDDEETP